ncbi:hypothetical protein FRC07_009527 [Ceratobasidium sp. 392]|nr:hypothetical protein FRC07_009527 [Ceratobasidium sp. 392]
MDADTLVCYGCLCLTGDGDKVCTAVLIDNNPTARNNSYIKYNNIPDKNTAFQHAPDVLVRDTNYGQLMDVYYIEFIKDARTNTQKPYLLAHVRHYKTNGLDAANPRTPVVTYTKLDTPDIIHLNLIDLVVGRIRVDDKTWAIVDRTRNGARTQFVDDDGNKWDG